MPIRPDEYVLGIDPDTHHVGLALVRKPRVDWVGIGLQSPKLRSWSAAGSIADATAAKLIELIDELHPTVTRIVIEAQVIYKGAKAQPNDIMRLSFAAGGILVVARWAFPKVTDDNVWIVTPQQWKGSTAKEAYLTRILKAHSWAPRCKVKGQHASHVIDAAGIASWGYTDANGLTGGCERLPSLTERSPSSSARSKPH